MARSDTRSTSRHHRCTTFLKLSHCALSSVFLKPPIVDIQERTSSEICCNLRTLLPKCYHGKELPPTSIHPATFNKDTIMSEEDIFILPIISAPNSVLSTPTRTSGTVGRYAAWIYHPTIPIGVFFLGFQNALAHTEAEVERATLNISLHDQIHKVRGALEAHKFFHISCTVISK